MNLLVTITRLKRTWHKKYHWKFRIVRMERAQNQCRTLALRRWWAAKRQIWNSFNWKVVFHEEYGRPDNYQNDIALIKLDREVRGCLIGKHGGWCGGETKNTKRWKRIHSLAQCACPGGMRVRTISGGTSSSSSSPSSSWLSSLRLSSSLFKC